MAREQDSPNILAIDGPAASGKGTLARKLAVHLNFALLDTGALYRAVALDILNAGNDPTDEEIASRAAVDLSRRLICADNPSNLLSDPAIRDDTTGQAASKLAAFPDVRDALLTLQRLFAISPSEQYKGTILDGRDIGTVICPQAQLKLFITASTETRADRRTKELQLSGKSVTYEAVLKDMRERDTRDASRKDAPMKMADDAILIETDELNQEQAFSKAIDIIEKFCPHWLS